MTTPPVSGNREASETPQPKPGEIWMDTESDRLVEVLGVYSVGVAYRRSSGVGTKRLTYLPAVAFVRRFRKTNRDAPDASQLLKAINIACEIIELGDERLLASDGPAGGQPPDLTLAEWGTLYATLNGARNGH